MPLILESAGRSDVGCTREHNEDSFRILQDHRLFLVADGMGGHRAGDVASELACKTLQEFYGNTEDEDITWPFQFDAKLSLTENRIVSGIKLANRRIFQSSISHAEQHGMGTTIVCLTFDPGLQKAYIAHVGDSRCYRLRKGGLELLTADHSLVNDYLKAMPDLTAEQLGDLPRNVITRALGMQEEVRVDLRTVEPEAGDLFILCSDGLNAMITDETIQKEFSPEVTDLKQMVERLIDRAKDAGGEDNVTVILIRTMETPSEEPSP